MCLFNRLSINQVIQVSSWDNLRWQNGFSEGRMLESPTGVRRYQLKLIPVSFLNDIHPDLSCLIPVLSFLLIEAMGQPDHPNEAAQKVLILRQIQNPAVITCYQRVGPSQRFEIEGSLYRINLPSMSRLHLQAGAPIFGLTTPDLPQSLEPTRVMNQGLVTTRLTAPRLHLGFL